MGYYMSELYRRYFRATDFSDLEERLGKKLDLLTTGSLDQQFLSHIAQEEVLLYDHTQS